MASCRALSALALLCLMAGPALAKPSTKALAKPSKNEKALTKVLEKGLDVDINAVIEKGTSKKELTALVRAIEKHDDDDTPWSPKAYQEEMQIKAAIKTGQKACPYGCNCANPNNPDQCTSCKLGSTEVWVGDIRTCPRCALGCKTCTKPDESLRNPPGPENRETCVDCWGGYTKGSTAADYCRKCAFGFVGEPYQLGYSCQRCEHGCKTCTKPRPNRDACTSCWANYNFDDKCVSCAPAWYQPKSGSCTACPSSCKTCALNAAGRVSCSECKKGFASAPSDQDKTCTICDVGYTGYPTCDRCVTGYFKNGDGSCVPCKATCLTCLTKSDNCGGNCKVGYAGDDCSACADGYRLVAGQCERCPEKCATCESNGTCKQCANAKYVAPGCDSCRQGVDPTSFPACDKCLLGWYLKADGTCVKCQPGCRKSDGCLDANQCDGAAPGGCSTGYINNWPLCNTCVEGRRLPATGCDQCTEGYFSVNNKDRPVDSCVKCNEYHADFKYCALCEWDQPAGVIPPTANLLCTKCQTPYVLDDVSKKCRCPDGQYDLDGAGCAPCPSQCKKCTSGTVCTTCNDGYVLGLNGKCDTCDEGYYELKSVLPLTCAKCDPKCESCADTSACGSVSTRGCTRCNLDKCKVPWANGAVPNQYICNQCNPLYTGYPACGKCATGAFTVDTVPTLQCEWCNGGPSTPCATCKDDSSDQMCTSCKTGYQFNPAPATGRGPCVQCNVNNCVACPSPLDSTTECGTCKDGYRLQGKTACERCTLGCVTCPEATNKCTECFPGYNLAGQSCVWVGLKKKGKN